MKPSSKLVCWHNALCHGQWQWAESISLGRSQHLATSGMTQRYCCCYFCWCCWRQLWCKWASDRSLSLSLSLSLSPFVTEHVMDRSHALALNTPRKEAQLIMFECHPKCVCVCLCVYSAHWPNGVVNTSSPLTDWCCCCCTTAVPPITGHKRGNLDQSTSTVLPTLLWCRCVCLLNNRNNAAFTRRPYSNGNKACITRDDDERAAEIDWRKSVCLFRFAG